MATSIARNEKRDQKHQDREMHTINHQNNQDENINSSEVSVSPRSCLQSCWDVSLDYFRRATRLRSYIIATAVRYVHVLYEVCFVINSIFHFRLTVGWSWETWLVSFFTLVTEEDHLSDRANIGINFVIAILIILAGFLAHYFIKGWSNYDLLVEEEEETTNPANHAGQNANSEEAGVANPIQSESVQRE